jgi:type IV secretion system protein VirB9
MSFNARALLELFPVLKNREKLRCFLAGALPRRQTGPTLAGSALAALLVLAAATPTLAAESPRPDGGDPRLRVVLYDPSQVVTVRAALGYQMMIEFDAGERIENVAVGDSLGWQVIPSRNGNLLFLKPMDQAPATNMTVVTNLRRYAFELTVRPRPARPDDPSLVYSLRFDYPAPATPVATVAEPTPAPPQDVNHAYSYQGSAEILPSRLFDDGQSTYFRFAEGVSYPAIFAVEADHSEAVVNFHVRDGYLVVDRLARGFVLRRGKEETRIFNDGFRDAEPGPLSPKPRRSK